jgi:hypothetical protein
MFCYPMPDIAELRDMCVHIRRVCTPLQKKVNHAADNFFLLR